MTDKLDEFAELCGDWDYRKGVDMTEPHLASIEIKNDEILPICELYSPDLEDYVFSTGKLINDKELLNEFKTLDLHDKSYVLDFINNVENNIDWERVSNDLYKQVEKQLEESDFEL